MDHALARGVGRRRRDVRRRHRSSRRQVARWSRSSALVLQRAPDPRLRRRRIAGAARAARARCLDGVRGGDGVAGRSVRSGTSAVHPETYPSLGRPRLHRLLSARRTSEWLRCSAHGLARIGGTLWLDGLTASLAAAALGAAVLVELVLRTTEGSPSTVATNLAYPLGDLLLLSAVFGVFSLTRWRPGRVAVLGSASSAPPSRTPSTSSRAPPARTSRDRGSTSSGRRAPPHRVVAWAVDRSGVELEVEGRPLLAVPAACALVAIGVLVYDHFSGSTSSPSALAAATLARGGRPPRRSRSARTAGSSS